MAHLGFVGLGAMGSRMVKRLLAAGHTVTGYNRTQSKAGWLLDLGMAWADSPRAVAETSQVTFSMVTNTAALQDITAGPDGILAGLGPGKVYVDMSTVNPAVTSQLAKQIAQTGAAMLDAPVSGSILTLEQGNLAIMVGGDPAVAEQVKPILLDIGPRVTYMGPSGQAVLMKIAMNLSLPVQLLAMYEGVLLAEKGGIPRATAIEALLSGAAASPAMKYRGPFALQMPEEAWFDVDMMQKDMLLALEMGRQLDVPLPTTAITNELLTAARALGWAKEDFAVLFRVLAKLAGIESTG
jgi:3-hydroxyisobutyrate dehydrogenase-like beta-hydroxyacid dehydrogenase